MSPAMSPAATWLARYSLMVLQLVLLVLVLVLLNRRTGAHQKPAGPSARLAVSLIVWQFEPRCLKERKKERIRCSREEGEYALRSLYLRHIKK